MSQLLGAALAVAVMVVIVTAMVLGRGLRATWGRMSLEISQINRAVNNTPPGERTIAQNVCVVRDDVAAAKGDVAAIGGDVGTVMVELSDLRTTVAEVQADGHKLLTMTGNSVIKIDGLKDRVEIIESRLDPSTQPQEHL